MKIFDFQQNFNVLLIHKVYNLNNLSVYKAFVPFVVKFKRTLWMDQRFKENEKPYVFRAIFCVR